MTEKQRWLLRELSAWRDKKMTAIGRYGPKRLRLNKRVVRKLERQASAINKQIQQMKDHARQPYERAKKAIDTKHDDVRRVILFEKTEKALAALKALR
jgi:hypothetical protein